MNGRKTEESLNQRRNNKKRNETDGFWNEGVERERRRGGDADKLQRALTNGTEFKKRGGGRGWCLQDMRRVNNTRLHTQRRAGQPGTGQYEISAWNM